MPVNANGDTRLITFEEVSFSYGATPALERISFSVHRGDFLALVGPNGGGKTTLAKLAMGLLRPQQGRILHFGQEAHQSYRRPRIGYVPQSASAFHVRFPATVGDVVSYGEYRGLDPLALLRRSLSSAVKDALQIMDLWEHRRRLINDLSVGQQQRVLIARALVSNPELLILDEPTAGVDVAGQSRFYSLLHNLNQEKGITVVLVSHDVGVVLHECARVACVNRTLVYHGAPGDLKNEDLSRLYGFKVDLLIHRHD